MADAGRSRPSRSTRPHAVDALRRRARSPPLADDADRPWPSSSPRAPPASPRARSSPSASWPPSRGSTWPTPGAIPRPPAAPMLAGTQFAHVGFMTKLPWYLRLGTTTHVLGRWRAADALACVAEHRIPSIGGVAPQIALLLREDVEAYDLDCVQTLIVGGAASPPALVREAEAASAPRTRSATRPPRAAGCGTGTAFDADDDEALFTRGQAPRRHRGGDPRRRRPSRSPTARSARCGSAPPPPWPAYWRDPEATAQTLVDGWLRTGDLGLHRRPRQPALAGRLKEMFIRGGYNVYPAEVEAVLADHPAVAEAVVVPRPDDVMGEIGVAVVVPGRSGAAARRSTTSAPSSSRAWPATSCRRTSGSSTSSRSRRCRRSTAARWSRRCRARGRDGVILVRMSGDSWAPEAGGDDVLDYVPRHLAPSARRPQWALPTALALGAALVIAGVAGGDGPPRTRRPQRASGRPRRRPRHRRVQPGLGRRAGRTGPGRGPSRGHGGR